MKPDNQDARRLHVMHVIHDDGAGGGPVAVKHLMDYLRDGFDQSFAHGGDGIAAEWCREHGIPHHPVPLNRKRLIPAGLLALVGVMHRTQPNVVIVHGQWGGPVGALAARLAGIRNIIYIAHFPSFYTDWGFLRVVRNRIAEAMACRLAKHVVTLSEGNCYQYLLRRLIDEDRALVIHSTVSPDDRVDDETKVAMRKQFGWRDDECHVVSVSRLSDQKRVDWLVKSWHIVCREEPRARLWIVGDGPERKKLEALAAKLELTNCAFLGAQPNGVRFIAAADVVAMTSLYEGHALVPLEAMVNGVPIVASDVDGVRESFSDGGEGFLVPPGDVQQFARRLLDLVRSPDLRAGMGQRGQERSTHFHPDTILPCYETIIRNLATPPRESPILKGYRP